MKQKKDDIATKGIVDLIESAFRLMQRVIPPTYRLTVIGRCTTVDEADFLLTTDEVVAAHDSLVKMIKQKETNDGEITRNRNTIH